MDQTAIDAWAKTRTADLVAREFGNSLSTVGPDKPLGSQGFKGYIEGYAVTRTCRKLGLKTCVAPGIGPPYFVYAWDPEALQALLAPHEKLLKAAKWGHDPYGFVRCCRTRRAIPGTPLFDLVADAYGDKTGPGRSDVLPGVPRQALMDAVQARLGIDDPTIVFFLST